MGTPCALLSRRIALCCGANFLVRPKRTPRTLALLIPSRCCRVVDLMLGDSPKFILIDEQSDDQMVHLLGLRKADGPAYQPLDPRPLSEHIGQDLPRVVIDGMP